MEENCEILYKVSNPYDQLSDVSISIFDAQLGVQLPCSIEQMTISEKDLNGESVKSLGEIFFI